MSNYFNTEEAAKVLGVAVSTARYVLQAPDCRKSHSGVGRKTSLYLKTRVLKIKTTRSIKRRKTTRPVCLQCHTILDDPMQVCECGCVRNTEDPFGVMLKHKYQDRPCPTCGARLLEGQYQCPACTAQRIDNFDANLAYGGMVE